MNKMTNAQLFKSNVIKWLYKKECILANQTTRKVDSLLLGIFTYL